MRTLILFVAVAVCLAAVPLAPAAKGITIRVAYQGGAPFGHTSPTEECAGELPASMGVACAEMPPGARTLTIDVKDASRLPVGGSYYLYDADGALVALGGHCGELVVDAPPGGLAVVRLEVANGPLFCADQGIASGEATKGSVAFRIV